jgi:hypothetical protein
MILYTIIIPYFYIIFHSFTGAYLPPPHLQSFCRGRISSCRCKRLSLPASTRRNENDKEDVMTPIKALLSEVQLNLSNSLKDLKKTTSSSMLDGHSELSGEIDAKFLSVEEKLAMGLREIEEHVEFLSSEAGHNIESAIRTRLAAKESEAYSLSMTLNSISSIVFLLGTKALFSGEGRLDEYILKERRWTQLQRYLQV